MSDADAASLLGVTRQEVLAYRVAHGVKRHRRATATPSTVADAPRGPTKLLRRRGPNGPVEELLVDAPPPVTADPSLPVPVPGPQVTAGRKSAATLLEGVRLKLGRVPDHVIAEEVGLSRDAVGIHRRKLGIPAYEGYQFTKTAPAPIARVPATAPRPAAEAPTKGRAARARLDAVRARLGRVPDDVIAREVGLSRGVVGAYRREHGIAAYDGYLFAKGHSAPRGPGRTPPGPTPKAEEGGGATPGTPAAVRLRVKTPADRDQATPPPMTTGVACRVVASAGDRRLELVAVGAEVADASARAEAWLQARDDGPWRVDEVLRLGVAVR